MLKSPDSTPVALSCKLYERLLAFYPRDHRREYGPPMAQLFHDQCRDAWVEARGWGLAVLWLRVSIDLVKTSSAERLRNLKQRKSMFGQMITAFRANPSLRTTFLGLFAVVFLLVFTSSALLAFLAPEQYASIARIKAQQGATDVTPESYERYVVGGYDPYFIQTQFALLQSEPILGRVARKLNLAESWGKTSGGGARLSEADTLKLLREQLDLRPVRNTSLIEIRVVSKNPKEASELANALAETYREFNAERTEHLRSTAGATTPKLRSVEIVDTAVPGLRPVRPNKPFTLFLGIFGGILLASVVGGAGALFVRLSRRLSRPQATTV